MRKIWEEEEVPEDMICGLFVMIYKGKGSSDDLTKYRCICLLNHAYKLLSAVLLIKVVYRSYKELLDFPALKGLVRPHTMRPLLCRAHYCHLLVRALPLFPQHSARPALQAPQLQLLLSLLHRRCFRASQRRSRTDA